jgi:hypothetical protein
MPPTGDLRFSLPHPNNVSWDGWKNIQAYGPYYLSYGFTTPLQVLFTPSKG